MSDINSQLVEQVEGLSDDIRNFRVSYDQKFEEMKWQVDEVVTAFRRPPLDPSHANQSASYESRAFATFCRQGKEALGPSEQKTLQVGDDTRGGYLVPLQFEAELLRTVLARSPVRQIATVGQMKAAQVIIPRLIGRPTAAWVGETATRAETEPSYGQLTIEAQEASCWVPVSNKLLDDASISIEAELSVLLGEELARLEGAAFVNGDGIGKPSGFMQADSVASVNSGSAAAITSDSLIDLYHAVDPVYRGAATWAMNDSTLSAARRLKDGQGQYLLLPAGVNGAPVDLLLGRPVVSMPDMPDVAQNAFPIVFGDFKAGFRIYDRVGTSILRDPFTQATSGITRFHCRRRVGGAVVKGEAFRKLKISA